MAQKTIDNQSTPMHQDADAIEMRIPARSEWVRVVRLSTAGVASRLGFSYDDIEDIKLAVAEACNNAILHGAEEESVEFKSGANPSPILIRWSATNDELLVSVTDEGRVASPGLIQPKKIQGDELPEGGMGLLLIQSLMDEVWHEAGPDSDTTIHMRKKAPNGGKVKGRDPDSPAVLSRPMNSASTPSQSIAPKI